VAIEKEPLPLSFQVETGIYVNAIRSSLDILSCTLADRHCKALMNDAYFPIAGDRPGQSAADYFADSIKTGKGLKGAKLVKALPAKERDIIVSLKPYKGGNGLLWPLHLLDIVRKHQRLLAIDIHPATLKIAGWGDATKAFKTVATWVRGADNETVLGFLANGRHHPKIEFTPQISFDETLYLPHGEVVATLYDFVRLAKAIIRNFDY
jgi:hypothetical protein